MRAGGDGTSRLWRVELSSDAQASMRSLPPVARRRVADALDLLEREGLPVGEGGETDAGARRIRVGDYELLVAAQPERRILLVARIGDRSPSAAHAYLKAAPLPDRARRLAAALASDLLQDVRFALRSLRRGPVFTAAVVLTLAVGLGGATALFSLVNAVYLAGLPFGRGDRLVRLRDYSLTSAGEYRAYNTSPRNFAGIRDGNRVFDGVVAQNGISLSLTGGERAERVGGVAVTEGWARTLGVRPAVGRVFTADEERLGTGAGVALISHGLWQRRFGGDAGVLGRDLSYDGGVLTVVGVMPAGFHYPYDADVWRPATLDETDHRSHTLAVVARLRDGVTLDGVREDMARVFRELAATAPASLSEVGIDVRTAREDLIGDDGRMLKALLTAVAFLLLLACVNVANLLAARFLGRGREVALRAALGAGRGRQVRQLCTETMLLFLAGGAGGVLLAATFGSSLAVLVPENLRSELALRGVVVDPALLGFALAASILTGLVFGTTAAARGGRADVQSMLKEGARQSAGRGDRRVQDALVIAQLALSVVLLVGAGLLVDHFRRLRTADVGFPLEDLVTLRITLEQERYAGADARAALVRTLQERIAAQPEVSAVGVATINPLCCGRAGAPIQIEGRDLVPDASPTLINHRYVTPAYFAAMGTPLVRGENFSPGDVPGGSFTVILDEPAARRFWPGEDPIGKRLRMARPDEPWRTVIGVVPAIHNEGEYTETWYLPYYQEPSARMTEQLHLFVRARSGNPVAAARAAVAAVDPALAVYGEATMASLRDALASQDRLGAIVAVLFAAFGLVLAAFGLYGLLAHVVERRSPEIGTRMALGATRGDVLRLVVGHAVARIALGLVVGLGLALAVNRLLRTVVEGIGWATPPLLASLLGLLLTVASLAAALPAWRAARVDPMRALRG